MYADLASWKSAILQHIDFASRNEIILRKKLDIIENSVTANRAKYYGYTARGMVESMKAKIVNKMSDGMTHEMRASMERAIIFVKSVRNCIIMIYIMLLYCLMLPLLGYAFFKCFGVC
jgi:hypothetical protein